MFSVAMDNTSLLLVLSLTHSLGTCTMTLWTKTLLAGYENRMWAHRQLGTPNQQTQKKLEFQYMRLHSLDSLVYVTSSVIMYANTSFHASGSLWMSEVV